MKVLEDAKSVKEDLVTKSSIMLGLGETDEEVLQTMKGECVMVNKDQISEVKVVHRT